MRYYMIAGERSGDLHGSNLIAALKKLDANARIRCWGGDLMKKAGGELAMHYRNTAFMGAWEAIVNIRAILKNLEFCRKDLLEFKPDVLVLIDYPGFNMRMARFARENGIKTIYYISPKVWAWNRMRVGQIKASVDLMLSVLPFEKNFYRDYGYEVEYVGNPVYDAVKAHRVDRDFIEKNELPEDKVIVALLPGSRAQEVKQVLPAMIQAVRVFPEYHFAIAGVKNLDQQLYAPAVAEKNLSVVYEQAYDLLAFSDAAVVTSGTATLETALWDVPQVVVYKTSALTYWLGKMVVKVKYISLVNLIAGKEVVKELIQDEMNAEAISNELSQIMSNKDRRLFIIQEYSRIKEMLKNGKASQLAAQIVFEFATKTSAVKQQRP